MQSLLVWAGQLACLAGHTRFWGWLSPADSDLGGCPLPASAQAPVSGGARLFFPHLAVEGCSRTSPQQWLRARFDLQHQLPSDKAASLSRCSFSPPTALPVFPHTCREQTHPSPASVLLRPQAKLAPAHP